jgi:DNA polymerase III epsilon subunit-like protein
VEIVFLDTETTGFGSPPNDKMVEIAVVGYNGDILLDTLVNPERPMGATFVHGITHEMVQDAPTFEECWETQMKNIFTGKHIVIFNASFDTRFFPDQLECAGKISCAMVGYQRVYKAEGGESNKYNLGVAMDHIGYSIEGDRHRALADTLACRAVWLWLEERISQRNLGISMDEFEYRAPMNISEREFTLGSNFDPSDTTKMEPLDKYQSSIETSHAYEVITENHLTLKIGDTVFLNIDPEKNPSSLDEITIEDTVNSNISVDKLIGKKCGNIISSFNYYGGLVNVQIADIKRNVYKKSC